MAGPLPPLPDWEDKAAYAPLAGVEPSGFAWEWLRRDPGYGLAAAGAAAGDRAGEEARAADAAAAPWGLHRFEPPGRTALEARPVWTAAAHPWVLRASARPSADEDALDLERIAGFATLVEGSAGEHLLLSDGRRSIRLDVIEGKVRGRRSTLTYLLSGLAAAERPLLVLRRFIALWRRGRFSRLLHPPTARAARQVLLLRTHDALAAGASQREIAAELVSRSASEPRWRTETPSSRLTAQRLVRDARRLSAGGWRRLLR